MEKKHLIDGIQPSQGPIYPEDTIELSSALSDITEPGKVVVPVGGATRLQIGAKMPHYDYALDLSNMNHLVAHNSADLTCIVQSGITLHSLQNQLREQEQFLAVDAAFPEEATIGGTLASNAPGYLRWQLAHMRDMVIGMQVVLPSGTVTKSGGPVVKNVAGYDMARLHIGGYGTLGVISEISFKLTPLPPRQGSLLVGFQSENELHNFSEKVFDSYVMPLALTGMNEHLIKTLQIDAPRCRYLMVIRIGGRQMAFDRQLNIMNKMVEQYQDSHTDFLEQNASDRLWEKIRDFKGYGSISSITGRVFSTPTRLRGLLRDMANYFEEIGSTLAVSIQPGFGTMEFYIESLLEEDKTRPTQVIEQIHNIARQNQSHINYEKLQPDLKIGFNMWGQINEGSLGIMRSLRDTYDPDKKLNRGRYLTDKEDS
ncbi:MAG: glycolate oxidase FAD binding subunit [Chloroflexi bacterium]|nr:MAG: glycolate oxidase FAD binding subunit [Chloroflexota bacterium]